MSSEKQKKDTNEQIEYQATLFSNRLAKKHRQLRKWARRERITCYRLYDRDIPEIPLAADLYEFIADGIADKFECAAFMRDEESRISANDLTAARDKAQRQFLHISLYERPYDKPEEEERIWLGAMAKAAAETLGIPQSHVMTKTRKKQRGESQYEKIESGATVEGTVQECGQLFKVNMSDYLDTGLFLDHRPLRQTVRQEAAGKSVLNLFCYTGSFSVYAAEGRARTVTSVDLSRTYIDWAKHNIALNEFNPDDGKKFIFHRGDVSGFLNQRLAEVPNAEGTNRFDIIVLDPPTFSNSKSTESTLDINRDWPELAGKCIRLLRKNGTLYFSTNSRRLQFDENLLPKETDDGAKIEVADMTAESIGEDFKNQKPHRLWRIRRLG